MSVEATAESAQLDVSVWRGTEDSGHFQDYKVPVLENQTVLDIVSWIQQQIDPTLTYRFACRVGMCGSCAMTVNGEPRWTCRTHVNKVIKGGSLTIEPLRNLPLIKDLVTDMDPFFDKWIAAPGVHKPTATRHDPLPLIDPQDPQRIAASAGIECINCAVCFSACDTVSANPEYLGPAALQRAWTLVNDVKNESRKSVLEKVASEGGCYSCHSQGSCSRYCPVELNPMKAIAGLKRATMTSLWRRAGDGE